MRKLAWPVRCFCIGGDNRNRRSIRRLSAHLRKKILATFLSRKKFFSSNGKQLALNGYAQGLGRRADIDSHMAAYPT